MRAAIFVAVFGLSLAMACARLIEAPGCALAWLRIGMTIAAFSCVAYARRSNLVQRAVLAFAIECAGGAATLIYVDAPYVNRHAPEIAGEVSIVYRAVSHRDIGIDLRALNDTR